MNWKELRALNNQRFENGEAPIEGSPDWLDGWDPNAPDADAQYDERLRASILGNGLSTAGLKASLNEIADRNLSTPQPTSEDIMSTGYGQEKIDRRIPFEEFQYNPVDTRANTQSWRKKIGNGIMNMSAVGLSTFADNTAGLITGILGFAKDAVDGDDEFRAGQSFREGLGFAGLMQDWREKSEEIFPTYRTIEEQADADHWWRHLNANFWGDTVLKNLGFTLGAGAAFGLYSKIPTAVAKRLVDKGYKAAVAAASGDANAVSTIRNIFSGAPIKNPGKALKALEKIQKSSNVVNWTGQLLGGVGGALGEARTEALMGAKEFRDDKMAEASERYDAGKDALGRLIESDSRYSVDGVLTQAGQDLWMSEMSRLQNEYNASVNQIEKEADTVSRRVFGYNMAILPLSNVIMFGKMAAGGFGTQSRARVRRVGNSYRPMNTAEKIIGGIGNAASEGFEEVAQKIISEGSKDIAGKNMAAFNNLSYDKDAIKSVSETIMSMLNSAGNVISDASTWQEFAVGFLTGGGSSIVTGISSNDDRTYDREAADRINGIVNSTEKLDQLKSIVRQKRLENIKDAALDEHDKFTWETANKAQLIDAAIAFDKAGKLDDLERIIDSFAAVDEKDIDSIKGTLIDETDPDFSKKTDAQLVDWLHKRAKDVKDTIKEYRGYHNVIDYLSYGTADEDAINELVYTRSQLDDFEKRYNSLLPKVINDIKPHLTDVSKRAEKDGTPTPEALKAQSLLGSETDLTTLFGISPSSTGFEDAADISTFTAPQIDNERQRKVLKTLEDWGLFSDKDEIRKEVEDLQKLVKSRQEFYSKLFDPESIKNFAKKHKKDKVTPEQAANEIKSDEVKEKTSGLKTAADVRNAYLGTPQDKRDSFLSDLDSVKDSNQAIQTFLNEKSSYDSFRSFLASSAPGIVNSTTGGFSNVAEIILDDVFANSDNQDELIANLKSSLPDINRVNEEVIKRVDAGIMSEDEAMPILINSQYNAAVDAIRKAVDNYKATSSKTDGRKSVQSSLEPKQERNSKITGVDNPEPATESKPPTVDEPGIPIEKVSSIDEITDNDFLNPTRAVELPQLPNNVDVAIGANGKPVIIKKNIFKKNAEEHHFTPSESRDILKKSLYNTSLVGRTQPKRRSNYWVVIKISDTSPITVLEVNENKDNVEVVGWYTLDERNLDRIKRQARREDGELLILTPEGAAASLSTLPSNLTSNDKDSEILEKSIHPEQKDSVIDASESYGDRTLDEKDATTLDRNGDPKLGYYQQSIPEIQLRGKKNDQNVFEKLKALVNQLKVATDKKEVSALNEQIGMLTRDFVQFDENDNPVGKNAAFGDTYKWLRNNHAFEYIATKLNVNDELVFCYMSGCPRYDGVPQVVVGVVKSRDESGNINAVQPLTTLHRPNSVSSETRTKYAYLDELYDAIQSDFDSRGPDGPLYVFGGKSNPTTSRVFGIRPGIVPFGAENNRIDQIEGYSDSAPIVMIGENNEPIVLRGNQRDVTKMFLPTRNNAVNRYGQLYYMVRNGGDSYTPIALGRKGLGKEVFDSAQAGGFVDGVKSDIAKIDNLIGELTDSNAAELNNKLSPVLKDLSSNVVLNDIFFEFKNIQLDDGSFANGLSIKWGDGKGENAFVESVSSRNTLDVLADLNLPVRLSPMESRRKDTIRNLSGAIADGLIETNAELLRQKGVNFMFDPWNPEQAKFSRLLKSNPNPSGIEIVHDDKTVRDVPMPQADSVDDTIDVKDSGSRQSDGLDDVAKISDINDAIGKSYDELSQDFKNTLNGNGVTQDVWDSSDSETRQAFLEC